jgi:hypothetical protein
LQGSRVTHTGTPIPELHRLCWVGHAIIISQGNTVERKGVAPSPSTSLEAWTGTPHTWPTCVSQRKREKEKKEKNLCPKNIWQRLYSRRLTRSARPQPRRTRAAGEATRAPTPLRRARSLSRGAHLSEATVQILGTAPVHFYPLAFPARSFLSSPLAFASRL